jgi:16S rRNA (adenine1518-N6/adenine1519-N6)-dimethyltransferase
MAENQKKRPARKASGSLTPNGSPRPQKRLGQHFLTDRAVVRKMIDLMALDGSEVVIEIGPGLGALTLPLAERVARVVAVEKDQRLFRILGEKIETEGIQNVTLLHDDILKRDLLALTGDKQEKIRVVGNLPYNISSPMIEKVILERAGVDRAVFMLQAEVAQRLAAKPGTKAYGALTVWVQYHAMARLLFPVSRKAFYPVPKVESMVVELDFRTPHPQRTPDVAHLRKVVKAAFAYRRKTILNAMAGGGGEWDKEVLGRAMAHCSVDPGRRAETLDLDEFLCIERTLSLTNRASGVN